MRSGVLACLLLFFVVSPAQADPPFPRIPVSVILAGDEADGLDAFRETLRLAVSRRDRDAVLAQVSPEFACFRDFGGLCEGTGGRASFELIFVFDDTKLSPEYAGWGWRRLAAMLNARTVGPVPKGQMLSGEYEELGYLCEPAQPMLKDSAAAEAAAASRGSDFWFDWAYVEAGGVRLRAGPSAGTAILDALSWEAVPVVGLETVKGEGAPEGWIEITAPSGRRGFVAARYLQSFLAPRLCYARDRQGNWSIAAHVGGGD